MLHNQANSIQLYPNSIMTRVHSLQKFVPAEETVDYFKDKYSKLLPLKGVSVDRNKPLNPLTLSIKNTTMINSKKLKRQGHRGARLPPIKGVGETCVTEYGIEDDEMQTTRTVNTKPDFTESYNPTDNSQSQDEPFERARCSDIKQNASAFRRNQSNGLGQSFKNNSNYYSDYYYMDTEDEPLSIRKKKEEFAKYDKRLKKAMDIRMQNSSNQRAKSLSRYFGDALKHKPHDMMSPLSSKFENQRLVRLVNEYPVLG